SLQTIIQLPIDQHLQYIGFAHKSFGSSIFYSHYNTGKHFAARLSVDGPSTGSRLHDWVSLPFPYKCELYNWHSKQMFYSAQFYALEMTLSLGLRLHEYHKKTCPTTRFSLIYIKTAVHRGLLEVVKHVYNQTKTTFAWRNHLPTLIKLALDEEHADVAEFMLGIEELDPSVESGKLLAIVAKFGIVDLVKQILGDPRMDAGLDDSLVCRVVFVGAVEGRHVNVLRLLMEDSRLRMFEAENNLALCYAISKHNVDMIDCLVNLEGFDPSSNHCAAFVGACAVGNVDLVASWLKDERVDPSSDNYCIYEAAANGHVQVLKLVLEDGRADPGNTDNADCIHMASEGKHIEVVRLLLDDGRADPSENENAAVIAACSKGSLDLVQLLLADARVDPSANDNEAINVACKGGYLEIVNELLLDPRVDPETATWESSIQNASRFGHVDVILRLLQDPRVDPTPLIRNAKLEWLADALLGVGRMDHKEKDIESCVKTECKGLDESLRQNDEGWTEVVVKETHDANERARVILETTLSECYAEMEALVVQVQDLESDKRWLKRQVRDLKEEVAYLKSQENAEDVLLEDGFAPGTTLTPNGKIQSIDTSLGTIQSPSSTNIIKDLEQTVTTLTRLLESSEKSRIGTESENSVLKAEMERMNLIVEDLRVQVEGYREESFGLVHGIGDQQGCDSVFVRLDLDGELQLQPEHQQQPITEQNLADDESFFVEYYSLDSFLVEQGHSSTRIQSPLTLGNTNTTNSISTVNKAPNAVPDSLFFGSRSLNGNSSHRRFSLSSSGGLGLGLAYENVNDSAAVVSLLSQVPDPIGFTLGILNGEREGSLDNKDDVIEGVDGLDLVDRRTPINLRDDIDEGNESLQARVGGRGKGTVLTKLVMVVYTLVFGK
ncbi:UNVERIFIED_CONTAM: hypothetical protein HDU68_002043, partial [Siphonaria sp. JEL0065]